MAYSGQRAATHGAVAAASTMGAHSAAMEDSQSASAGLAGVGEATAMHGVVCGTASAASAPSLLQEEAPLRVGGGGDCVLARLVEAPAGASSASCLGGQQEALGTSSTCSAPSSTRPTRLLPSPPSPTTVTASRAAPPGAARALAPKRKATASPPPLSPPSGASSPPSPPALASAEVGTSSFSSGRASRPPPASAALPPSLTQRSSRADTMELPCLSMREPFASAMVDGVKLLESRNTPMLQPYAGSWLGVRATRERWANAPPSAEVLRCSPEGSRPVVGIIGRAMLGMTVTKEEAATF